MLYTVEIGKNIVQMRKDREISQEQLALRSDLCVSWVRKIEHGKTNPTSDTLESLARTLEVELPVLFIYSMSDAEILSMVHRARRKGKGAV